MAKLWTVKDVAEHLSISRPTVYKKIEEDYVAEKGEIDLKCALVVLFKGNRKRTVRFNSEKIIVQTKQS